jgi:Xaa-Pro aminopeptidase
MKTARLMVADTEHDANMLYAVGMFVPDPFIYFEVGGKKYVVMSDLEVDRANQKATVDRVLSHSRYVKELKRAGLKAPRMSDVIKTVLREYRVKQIEVPGNFPVGIAQELRGIKVRVKKPAFFPEREIKRTDEVRKISDALRITEQGMAAGIRVLRASRIGRNGCLFWHGEKLTSERLRGVIHTAMAAAGGTASATIVAGGNQGCDPHETGYGPLKAHQTIILDIFPRAVATGYWGDMTRTVVRGRASEAVRKLYATVGDAQQIAFSKLRDGINGKEIHDGINALFKKNGYKTGRQHGRMQGFFHGTGHGVGLQIHEGPRLGNIDETMRKGQVVTVEPGLYYWGVGGVRLEDVVLVQATGNRLLSNYPKVLEI